MRQLKSLAGESSEDWLAQGATFADGRMIAAKIPWFKANAGSNKSASTDFSNASLLGMLQLSETQLVASVNSTSRAESIRKIIEERLGEQVTYRSTGEEPLDLPFSKMWSDTASVATGSDRLGRTQSRLTARDIIGGNPDRSSSTRG